MFVETQEKSVLDILKSFADLCFDLVAKFYIVGQKLFYGFTSLGKFRVIVAEP